jgi:hypothetical protein
VTTSAISEREDIVKMALKDDVKDRFTDIPKRASK